LPGLTAPHAKQPSDYQALAAARGYQWLGPPVRMHYALTYDAAREQVLLFGGFGGRAGSFSDLNDFWAWNGSAWDELQENSPSQRAGARLAFDTQQNVAV
jgi:hypothetical protein